MGGGKFRMRIPSTVVLLTGGSVRRYLFGGLGAPVLAGRHLGPVCVRNSGSGSAVGAGWRCGDQVTWASEVW